MPSKKKTDDAPNDNPQETPWERKERLEYSFRPQFACEAMGALITNLQRSEIVFMKGGVPRIRSETKDAIVREARDFADRMQAALESQD